METVTNSEEQTQKVAFDFAKQLQAGDVVTLYGDLGAGKTVFVKGIARGLGINTKITSPTFIFQKTYKKGKLTFHHLDLYRAENIGDLKSLDLFEIFSDDAIVVVEWADRIFENLPKQRWEVKIAKVDENTRRIRIIPPNYSSSDRAKRGNREVSGSTKKFLTLRSNSGQASSNINKAANIIKSGGVVIFPTDTVYGIGCLFDNQKAKDRIYEIKGTQKTQVFPILISNIRQVEELAVVGKMARDLMNKFWPGGLTIILPIRRHSVSASYVILGNEVTPESELKLGFRMPNSDLVRSIIDKVGKPIVGTSANFHGHPAPKSYEELDTKFTKLADYVLVGECSLGQESTVVDTTVSPSKILRQGAVKLQ